MDEQQKKMAEELLFSETKQPSFAKQLYFGKFDSSTTFPFPEDQPENTQFLQQVKDFVFSEIDPTTIDRDSSIPDSVIQGLGKLGVLGVTIPKAYGGWGLSQQAYCKAVDLIARRCGATALFVNAHQSVGLKALVLFGTEEQKNRYLPKLANGEMLAAFSLTEPNAGSDASGIETRAVYDPAKKTYKITGRKQWTTNGAVAGVLTVMAKTEGDKVTAFIVTPDMPGFKVLDAALDKVGMRGSKTANLLFEEVEVPESNILGKLGGGLRVCLTVLDYGRTTFGATCTGAARTAVERALEHAKTRIQFKQPLAAFPLVKKKIATMSALLYAMDASTYLTAGLIDRHVEDVMLESAILKVFASESLWTILYESMQIFGGRSFFTDMPLERMMRDARLNMIGEGANEVLRAFIGVVGMRDVGVQLKGTLDSVKKSDFSAIGSGVSDLLRRWKVPEVPVKSQLLDSEASQLGKAVRTFGWGIVQCLGRYREEIVDQQLVLDRIATAVIALYTSTAVLSKLDSELARGIDNTVVGKYYVRIALQQFDLCMQDLFSEEDEQIEKVSDHITGVK